MTHSQLTRLAKPFPTRMVHQRPQGGRTVDFVSHGDVVAKLLSVVHVFDMDVHHVHGDTWKVVLCMTIDGQPVSVADVATDDNAESAVSRAMCRAAMRVGVGLNLWSRNDTLYQMLSKQPQDPTDLTRQRAEIHEDEQRLQQMEDERDEREEPDGPEPWDD